MKLPELSKLFRKAGAGGEPPPADSSLPEDLRRRLDEEAQAFTFSHRYASGVRQLLKYLDEYPGDEHIRELLMIVIGAGWSYGNAYEAAKQGEELTEELISDTRLDSLFNECPVCGSTWISTHHLFGPAAGVTITNPVGGRCVACGKVFCQKCLARTRVGMEVAVFRCPECGGDLGPILKPTGRRSRQSPRVNLPLEFVLFLREGLIPPDAEYMTGAFRRVCPDVMESGRGVRVSAFPNQDWNVSPLYVYGLLAQTNPEYLSEAFQTETTEGVYEGDRIYIVRVYRRAPAAFELDPEDIRRLAEDAAYAREAVAAAEACREAPRLFEFGCRLLTAGNFTAGLRCMERYAEAGGAEYDPATLPEEVRRVMGLLNQALEVHARVTALLGEGKADEALEALLPLKEVTPRCAALHSTLGWLYILNGMFARARESLTLAIALDPYLPEAHNNFGMLHLFERRRETAAECFRKALELRPDYREARQNLNELDRNLLEVEENSRRDGANGICFWFDWGEISDSGHGYYGRYVFRQLLPHFSPEARPDSLGQHIFFDGDCLSPGGAGIHCRGAEERACAREVLRRGPEACYIVAVCSESPLDFAEIDRALREAGVTGYIGMTSCADRRSFLDFVRQVSLVTSFNIDGGRFRKQSFGFLSDVELAALGFEVLGA